MPLTSYVQLSILQSPESFCCPGGGEVCLQCQESGGPRTALGSRPATVTQIPCLLIHKGQFTPYREGMGVGSPWGHLWTYEKVLKGCHVPCSTPVPLSIFASWNNSRWLTKARAFILLELRNKASHIVGTGCQHYT